MPLTKGMFTSLTDEWATPQDLFNKLDVEFRFTLDPCATKENAKCKQFFTKEGDGLSKPWAGRVYMNPPYGRAIGAWVKKAHEEVTGGGGAEIAVCLLPARTDTRWFHDYCLKGEVRFIKGRVKFVNGKTPNSAPFPSVIVIFRKQPLLPPPSQSR